jgi:hypothetical protein
MLLKKLKQIRMHLCLFGLRPVTCYALAPVQLRVCCRPHGPAAVLARDPFLPRGPSAALYSPPCLGHNLVMEIHRNEV